MVRNFNKTIALIAGSGLAQGLEDLLEDTEHKENVINEFGTVLSYYIGYHGKTRLIILPRHGDSLETPARSPAELVRQRGYEANVWELYKLGVDEVYGLSAVGVLDKYTPLANTGTFIVPHTFIRGIAASQHTLGNLAADVHTNMSCPFDERLRQKIVQAIESAGYTPREEGIYIYNGGDTFETPDEIDLLDRLTRKSFFSQVYEYVFRKKRDRLVGMTTVPEAILLRQMRIPFAVLCSNVNYAEGLSKKTLVSHEQTMDIMGTAAPYLLNIIRNIVSHD